MSYPQRQQWWQGTEPNYYKTPFSTFAAIYQAILVATLQTSMSSHLMSLAKRTNESVIEQLPSRITTADVP